MKFNFLFFIIFYMFMPFCFSQQYNTDSLLNVLKNTKQDTLKIDILCTLCSSFTETDSEKALFYVQKGLSLAKKIKNKKSIAACYYSIAYVYFQKSDYSNALLFFEKSLKIFKDIGDKKNITLPLNGLGSTYLSQGDYPQALDYYKQTLKISEEMKDSMTVSTALINIGNAYTYIGNYPLAIVNFQKSLKISEGIKDKNGICYCLHNIGSIHFNRDNYYLALEYFQKSLKLSIELDDNLGVARNYISLGNVYLKQKKHILSLENIHKALEISEKTNDKESASYCLSGIGDVYNEQGKYKLALESYQKSLKISYEINDKNTFATTLILVAHSYFKLEKYADAINNAQQALTVAKEINSLENIKNAYSILAESYAKTNNYAKAYEYSKYFKETNDSIYNNNSSKQVHEMETKYQTEKKEQQLKLQDTELIKNKLEIKQSLIQKYIMYGVLFFIIVITIIILISLRNKRRANRLLTIKNAEILQQKEEILAQSEELHAINIQLEKLSVVASETVNAVFIADKNGTIEWINQGAVRMYGENVNSEIGKTIAEVSNTEQAITLLDKCLNEKISVHYDSSGIYNSKQIFTQTTLTPVLDYNGEVNKVVIIDTDITEIKKAEKIIQQKNNQILDSIHYAKLIQDSILPNKDYMKEYLDDYFIFFRPKDIVSGDFYWFTHINGKSLIAAIDCTGHGVPGAFMSMIGNTLLNNIVKEKGITDPSEILNNLHLGIVEALKGDSEDLESGMDMSLCVIDAEKRIVEFAGAMNGAYVVKGNKLEVIEADDKSIGSRWIDKDDRSTWFTTKTIHIEAEQMIYLSSDGYMDQFGGEKELKYGNKRFVKLFTDISDSSMIEQQEHIEKAFHEWIGSCKQIDDILVIGIKFKNI